MAEIFTIGAIFGAIVVVLIQVVVRKRMKRAMDDIRYFEKLRFPSRHDESEE